MYDPQIHHRQSMRLQSWDYSRPAWYYVTISTKDRTYELGYVKGEMVILNSMGKIVEESWRWLGDHHNYVNLDDFVIMPNHLHGIIILNEPRRVGSRTDPTRTKPLGRLIGAFKTVSTKRINDIRRTPGRIFWQRSFYDHIIRNDADLHRIRTYIANNPLKWAFDNDNHRGQMWL